MINNIIYIVAIIVLLCLLFPLLPSVGIVYTSAKCILIIAAILVLIQLTTNKKFG